MILTNLICEQQSTRPTPCVLIVGPDAIEETLFLGDFENASNRAASFLEKELDENQTTFFYIGPSDVRYFIWILAAMKTEKCVVFPSPGNTVPSNQRLFNTVGARTMLYAPEAEQMLAPLLEATHGAVKSIITPSYADLTSKDAAPTVHALKKSFEEVKDVAVLGLHTSGTSGHPKPIYWTHASIKALASQSKSAGIYPDRFKSASESNLAQDMFAPGEVVMGPFPLYHMGGICPIFFSILYGNTHVMPATGTKLTSENITKIWLQSGTTSAWAAPSLLEDMLDFSPGLDALASMNHVLFGGGPMNPMKGDKLSTIVRHLCGYIGSTEGGTMHLISPPDSSYWNEFNFADVGQRMEEVDKGVFELVYPNTDLTRRCQLYFHSYPELSEYRTKDLFTPTPGKDGWWTYRGRTDNWVVMSNALKLDPTDTENTVGGHPDVRGVLVAGDRRYRLCLLVELRDHAVPANDAERDELLNRLWPTIEEANQRSVKFGRIPRELVYFASREKPFLRASKGTIQRRLTIEAFADEIGELYAKAEQGLLTKDLPPLETLSQNSFENLLRYLYADVLQLDDGIGTNNDLLGAGIDSFGIMTILSRLKAALRQYGVSEAKLGVVSVKNLYSASTIGALAKVLETKFSSPRGDAVSIQGLENDRIKNDISFLIEKYTEQVQALCQKAPVTARELEQHKEDSKSEVASETVLLTGSTGSLGSYLLQTLLSRRNVKKVICLNRGCNSMDRQVKAFEARELLPSCLRDEEAKGRVVFLQADLTQARLGLTPEEYSLVMVETTIIIHNAYPVNFLMSIWQFEPHLVGLLNLMDLALHSGASLMFVSSISTGMSATGKRRRIPEIVLETSVQVDDLLPQGYAQSKYVCERMLVTFAARFADQSVSILRVGQICGPRLGNGSWNRWEWFPSLVISSQYLGVAPADIGQQIDWIPVDELAGIISDLMIIAQPPAAAPVSRRETGKTRVFNIVNPRSSPWENVLIALRATISETIPASLWVERLEESVARSTYLLDQNPGAKLVAFYKGVLTNTDRAEAVVDVDNLVQASPTAQSLAPIMESDIRRWMQRWV